MPELSVGQNTPPNGAIDKVSEEELPEEPPPPLAPNIRRAKSSRFSLLLENSVDYTAYRAAYGRQLLQQQPKFDSMEDAKEELKSVLHDEVFTRDVGSVMAENVALAVDWFISALVLLFDGEDPFQDQEFLNLWCIFFASPLYENNTRLVQRHLVKRTYAELNIDPTSGDYEPTLWLLLAFLHLMSEFQPDTFMLCRNAGVFPLLARAATGKTKNHVRVLAMSLMFEISQYVTLTKADMECVTDDMLAFLLDYVERMRYAENDVYNNTASKLLVGLNEQFLKLDSYSSMYWSPLGQNGQLSRVQLSRPHSTQSSATISGLASSALLPPSPDFSIITSASFCSRPNPARRSSRVSDVEALDYDGLLPVQVHKAASVGVAEVTQGASMSGASHSECIADPAPDSSTRINGLNKDRRKAGADADGYFGRRKQPLHTLDDMPRTRSMDLAEGRVAEGDIGGLVRSVSEARDGPGSRRQSAQGKGRHATPVIRQLSRRVDCCKTFAENLVFLVNRESEPITQIPILHMLYCILSDRETSAILYTNDMYVLIDIIIRELGNLSDWHHRLRKAYLLVLGAILRNAGYGSSRHRISDIELCLVNLLRHTLMSSAGCSSGSPSVCSTTPRLSLSGMSDLTLTASEARPRSRRTSSGALSPTLSLASSIGDVSSWSRSIDTSPVHTPPRSAHSRPAPPPTPPLRRPSPLQRKPPPPTPAMQPAKERRKAPKPPPRRRPPPPPPPLPPRSSTPLPKTQRGVLTQTDTGNGKNRVYRRRPPPPPPPQSQHYSHGCPQQEAPLEGKGLDTPKNGRGSAIGSEKSTTGLRRKLSVKATVSRYKRGHCPPPPPRHSRKSSEGEEGGAQIREEGDPEGSSHWENPEERRATRKLVESALRYCHEVQVTPCLEGGPGVATP